MNKIKLMAIVPYEGLAEAVNMVSKKYADVVDTTVRLGDLQKGLSWGQDAQADGYEVVISRGGTAELLLKNLSIPVVKIEVSGYDYMRAIKMATAISGMKAIVGYASITNCARSVSSLLNADIRIETVMSSEEIPSRLESLREAGCSLVIGDVATYRIAREMGMNAMLITSGEESITSAFDTVIWLMRSFGRLKSKNAMLETLLANSSCISVVLDEKKQLRYESRPLASVGLTLENLTQNLHSMPADKKCSFVLKKDSAIYRTDVTIDEDAADTRYMLHILCQPVPENELKGIEVENYYTNLQGTAELFDSGGIYDADTVKDAIAFSQTEHPILITGRPGIGKTQLARYIHRCSEHWKLPFVKIDCNIVDPVTALERLELENAGSTLHRGATVCFAEIDRLSASQQNDLCIALEKLKNRQWRFAATSAAQTGNQGGSDSAKRLEQFFPLYLHIPNIPRTGKDMERFINLNIIEFNSYYGKQIVGMEPEAVKLLLQYPWESDYYSLKRAVGQMVLLTDTSIITAADVRHVMRNRYPTSEVNRISLKGTLAEIEMEVIRSVLKEEKDNYSRTAARLGIGRSTLWRKLGNCEKTGTVNK